jgi:hypothetical protein
VLGSCALALAVAGQALVVPLLQARIDAVSDGGQRAARPGAAPDGEPLSKLDRFYHHFRQAGPLTAQLATLDTIAARHGIALRQGEYRLSAQPDGRLLRYQVTLPLAGPYPDLRRFLGDTLDAIPTASLDHVTLERKRIGERGVEAQVRLTFYVDR